MIYPPDIQRRLAAMSRLSHQEQFDLHCEIVAFAKKEARTHGRMMPDAFPELYPPTREDVEEMRNAFLFNQPLLRFVLGCQSAIRRWASRKWRTTAGGPARANPLPEDLGTGLTGGRRGADGGAPASSSSVADPLTRAPTSTPTSVSAT